MAEPPESKKPKANQGLKHELEQQPEQPEKESKAQPDDPSKGLMTKRSRERLQHFKNFKRSEKSEAEELGAESLTRRKRARGQKREHRQARPAAWYLTSSVGLLATGVSLMVGEFMAGLNQGSPTLVVSIGNAVVRSKWVPEWFREFGIQQGSSQKPLLILGIVLTTLALGVGLGILVGAMGNPAYKKRTHQTRFVVATLVFIFFGVIGGLTMNDDPFASTTYAVITPLLAVALGFATFIFLLGIVENTWAALLDVYGEDPVSSARRNFVLGAGATAIFAGIGSALGRRLINDARVSEYQEDVSTILSNSGEPRLLGSLANSPGSFDHVDNLAKFITPNDDFYRIDTIVTNIPIIDPSTWKLKVTGMVEKELEMSFEELVDMGLVEELVTLSCVSNRVGGPLVGNAIWRGIPLKQILDRAGVDPNKPSQIVGRSADNWTAAFPTELAYQSDRTSLVAVEMNGEPLPGIHGFPARLVVSGLYGYVSATKWLEEIEIASPDFDAYWVPRGWSKEGPIKTQSRIDVPRFFATLPPGRHAVAGVAWAPYRGISKVEINIIKISRSEPDVSSGWFEVELSNDVSDHSWRQWFYDWNVNEVGSYRIQVRATDGDGATQTSVETEPHPNGASGWDESRVLIEEP